MNQGSRFKSLIASNFEKAYGLKLEEIVEERNAQLLILGMNDHAQELSDLTGDVEASVLKQIQDRSRQGMSDAGMRANAHVPLKLEQAVDIFLINDVYLSWPDSRLEPLVAHEVAHYIDQLKKCDNNFTAADKENGKIIIHSFEGRIREMHSLEWARLLARAARIVVESKSSPYKTVREYLEAAIPVEDRPRWAPTLIQEPPP